MSLFHRFVRDGIGATAIEHALMAVTVGIGFVRPGLEGALQGIGTCLVTPPACTNSTVR